MKKYLLFILMALMLVGCGKNRDGSSVWGGALWILPWIGIIATIIFLISGYRSSKSNSNQQLPGGGYSGDLGNVSIFKTWQFKFAVVLVIATIAVIIGVNANKG